MKSIFIIILYTTLSIGNLGAQDKTKNFKKFLPGKTQEEIQTVDQFKSDISKYASLNYQNTFWIISLYQKHEKNILFVRKLIDNENVKAARAVEKWKSDQLGGIDSLHTSKLTKRRLKNYFSGKDELYPQIADELIAVDTCLSHEESNLQFYYSYLMITQDFSFEYDSLQNYQSLIHENIVNQYIDINKLISTGQITERRIFQFVADNLYFLSAQKRFFGREEINVIPILEVAFSLDEVKTVSELISLDYFDKFNPSFQIIFGSSIIYNYKNNEFTESYKAKRIVTLNKKHELLKPFLGIQTDLKIMLFDGVVFFKYIDVGFQYNFLRSDGEKRPLENITATEYYPLANYKGIYDIKEKVNNWKSSSSSYSISFSLSAFTIKNFSFDVGLLIDNSTLEYSNNYKYDITETYYDTRSGNFLGQYHTNNLENSTEKKIPVLEKYPFVRIIYYSSYFITSSISISKNNTAFLLGVTLF